MRVEDLFKVVAPIVESRFYSESAPLFLVCESGVRKTKSVRAVAFVAALAGANVVIVDGDRNAAVKALRHFGAEGILDICEYENYCDLILENESGRNRVARINARSHSDDSGFKAGEVSVF